MIPQIVKGVLITQDLMLDLGEVYATHKDRTSPSITFSIRGACKKDITVTKDCDLIWQLLTEYHDWEIDGDDIY